MDDHSASPRSRRSLCRAVAVVGAAALAGCGGGSLDAEATVTRGYGAADVTALSVETVNGDVDIRGSDRETVELNGTKRAANEDALDRVSLRADRDGATLSLTVDIEEGGFLAAGPTPAMDLTLEVPAALSITATTTNGEIDCETGSPDSVATETTNGDIGLAVAAPSTVRAETTNGDVALSMTGPADVRVGATNGDVEVTLPAGAEPVVEFETANGRVRVTGLDAGTVEADSGLRRTIGAGTHRIAVETTNGDLTVRGRTERRRPVPDRRS